MILFISVRKTLVGGSLIDWPFKNKHLSKKNPHHLAMVLTILCAFLRMHKRPFQRLSDLQLGDEKVP